MQEVWYLKNVCWLNPYVTVSGITPGGRYDVCILHGVYSKKANIVDKATLHIEV